MYAAVTCLLQAGEGCSATQKLDFLRSHQTSIHKKTEGKEIFIWEKVTNEAKGASSGGVHSASHAPKRKRQRKTSKPNRQKIDTNKKGGE